MPDKVYNFSAGPAALPKEVMLRAQKEFVNFKGIGYGLIEESHRSPSFSSVIEKTEADLRELMEIDDNYEVLFLQGGASLQFAMIPMNIMLDGKPAYFADTGAWASKAAKEAKKFGGVNVVYSGKESNYTTIDDWHDWDIPDDGSFLHICTNNTIYGTQYRSFPETSLPLVADMSSDILSRRINVQDFGIIFAGAQKNLGPAGVTIVIIRKDLAERAKATLPTMLNYNTHISKKSMFNTPCTFAVYMVGLVLEWIKKSGGIEAIEKVNQAKSSSLYEAIDESSFYSGTAEPGDRSKMNICFRLPSEELEAKFIKEAKEVNLVNLKGHRSVGGVRASIYNAMPLQGVERLIDFMHQFEDNNG